MANSRIARFIMEVAPPQYVTVMRHRTSKMSLDTITEEDQREIGSPNNDHRSHDSSSSTSSSLFPKASSSASASSSSVSIPSADSKYFLKEVHRSLSNLNH
ncbi:uncharacterized protein LOC114759524 [Neltuma alba]|uniref:uncharacterized protein LOC114759524 n=1 Tax=Neltuma alba TaxID=207710 RepID=UPI0010A2DABE|nr:uncharacterized protein LOC114759524 [Prosopis alba]